MGSCLKVDVGWKQGRPATQVRYAIAYVENTGCR
jgi:hypothetical protein